MFETLLYKHIKSFYNINIIFNTKTWKDMTT